MTTQVTVGTAGNSKATRIRSAFRDAEALALDAVGDPPEGAGDEGGHVHVHLHNGTTEKPAASEPDQSQAPPAVDPNEARFAALESGQAAIVEQLAAIGDAVKALASAEAVDADEDAAEDAEDAVDAEKGAAESGEKAGGDGDDNKKAATMDSAALETSYRATLSLAEVLVPGFRMPTFDARIKRSRTIDTLCAARRKALDSAYATQDGKALVDGIHGAAPNMVAMDCAAVASLFKAAAGAKKLLNNSAATRDSGRMAKPAADRQEPGVRTLEDLNRANAAFYAQKH